MPSENTPPESPAEFITDDVENIGFDEQDVLEVIEDDSPQESSDLDDENDEAAADEYEAAIDEEIIPERDDSNSTFAKHTDGVLCCAFHPKINTIAASGGMDDAAYVWDIVTGEVLMSAKVHEDSVEMIAFSYDGKYLATSDLMGNIRVWNTSDYSLSRKFELEDDLSWSLWHHGSNVLIGASMKGLIYMFKVATGETKLVMSPFGQTCMCGKVLPDGKRLAVGYTEGYLKIIDLKQGTQLSSVKVGDENCAVSSLDTFRDNNLIICGCDNGDVILFSSQAGKVVAVLNSNKATSLCSYVEVVAFCKDHTYNVAASGSLDGNVIIWDISKQIMRHRTGFMSCVNQLIWHPNQPILLTSHSDGLIHVYDAKSGTVLRQLMGHKRGIYSMALSPDASWLMTTSGDNTVRIYKTDCEKQN